MLDTLCTLPLSSDLFAQAIHPSAPLVAVGLSSGHVQCLRLPPVTGDNDESNDAASASENGYGQVETAWRTRRHKGSCRTLGFSFTGDALYSSGTDGVVKAASVETGKVFSKIAVPDDPRTDGIDPPTLLHALSPQTLLLATDSSALHLYDIRANHHSFNSSKPQNTFHPHDDYISSLSPLPPSNASTSGFSKQWVSTGGTTLAVTDLRRGVLVKSEDQEEELLSSTFVGGLSNKGTSTGEKVLVGGADGVITLWERGVWDDQDERITLNRGGDSVDAMAQVPEDLGIGQHTVVAGMGNGCLAFVKLGVNKVVEVLQHDEVEGVVAVGFETGGRMISGGGPIVKVWREKIEVDDDKEDAMAGVTKRGNGDDEDDSEDSNPGDERSEEENSRKPRKRRRKSEGINGIASKPMFKGLD